MSTMFADEAAFQAGVKARNTVTPESKMATELLRRARAVNLTAAPPAHIRPTVWSDSVDLSASIVVPAAVQANPVVAVTFTVPDGRWARIEQYGVNVLDEAYTYDGSILFYFRQRGRFLDQGMSAWGEQRGTMVFPRKTVIIVQEGETIEFMVRRAVAAGAPQTVQMGFRGWTWRLRNNYEGTQASVTAY